MIKRSADMEKEVRERMRGGTGSVEFLHIFRREELKGKVRLLARLRLPSGSSIGYHMHEGEEAIPSKTRAPSPSSLSPPSSCTEKSA